jgi:hypothetical protein
MLLCMLRAIILAEKEHNCINDIIIIYIHDIHNVNHMRPVMGVSPALPHRGISIKGNT